MNPDQENAVTERKAAGKLALGTAQFGMPYGIANRTGRVAPDQAQAILEQAAQSGVDTLDTAMLYGESEACLGQAGIDRFRVVTKLPALPDGCPDVAQWVEGRIGESLRSLNATAVYGVLLHRPGQLLEAQGKALYRALQQLKESGRARKIGVSVYGPEELELLAGRYRFDLVQAPFNLVDQRLRETGWLQRLKDQGETEIHTRSVFLQGLLLMRREELPARFSAWPDVWNAWHGWLAGHGMSALEASLALPLRIPEIDRVIVGVDSLTQFKQILAAAVRGAPASLPDIRCHDENLINPARWNHQ